MTAAIDRTPQRRAALWYAEKLGWPVAPAHYILPGGGCSCGNSECSSPGKHPLTPNGFKDATTDAAAIRDWWTQHPDANVIVPTGGATGLLVLDIDPDHGGAETLAALEARHGALPATVEQITGSGGRHLLFRSPGPGYRNTASKVGPGVDSRGDGGYIIVAPSNHKSGNVYHWRDGHKPGQIDIAEARTWLLGLLKKGLTAGGGRARGAAARSTNGDASAYVETALAEEVKATATATEGTRNAQLNTSAFALGQLVGAALVDQGRVERALTDAAQAAGLVPTEIEPTLRSGLAAGIAEPREVPEARRAAAGDPGFNGAYDVRVVPSFQRVSTSRATETAAVSPISSAWPAPLDDSALHGLAGRFVRTVEPHSEADPVALLVQFLVAFGSAVGRGPHFIAEADRHGVNLGAVFVGETAKGRKGTSWGHAKKIITAADPDWSARMMSGLSSGEGLIWQVRDEIRGKHPVKEKGRVTGYEEVVTDEA